MEPLNDDEDPRMECKYGRNCYQKNPAHLSKFKHPSSKKRDMVVSPKDDKSLEVIKKPKLKAIVLGKDEKLKGVEEDTSIQSEMGVEEKETVNKTRKEEISDSSDSESESDSQARKEPKAVGSPISESSTTQSSKVTISESESSDSGKGESPMKERAVRKKPVVSVASSKESSTTASSREAISESSDSDTPASPLVKETAKLPATSPKAEVSVEHAPTDMISERSDTDTESKSSVEKKEVETPVPKTISLEDYKKRMKELFLVEMPKDFFSFWDFCLSLSKTKPLNALKSVGLTLVGPFDVLAGNFDSYKPKDESLSLTHWRYYYDPPEFQTVLKGDDKTLYHIGYFRDDPAEPPGFLASNCAAKDCIITPMAKNIFGAVNCYLETLKKTGTPFQKVPITGVQKALQAWAAKNRFSLDVFTMNNRRSMKIQSKTFHGAGIKVPVQKKTDLGYRELYESDANLKKILKLTVESENASERDLNLEKLQPIITAANIANDECDFGTSLELGIDLFSFGGDVLQRSALQLLATAYPLLGRHEFAQIIEAHLKRRLKGSNLSILNST